MTYRDVQVRPATFVRAALTALGLLTAIPASALVPLTVATQVSASGSFSAKTCAVVDGGVLCWGINSVGQLGNNARLDSPLPVVTIPRASGVTAVATAEYHGCAVVSGGLSCWGGNGYGQLGVGPANVQGSGTPVAVIAAGSEVTAVSTADTHTCVVVRGGVHCWGDNRYGQLGAVMAPGSSTVFQPVGAGSGVTSVATAMAHTCVVKNGGIFCWGENYNGALGNGTSTKSFTPVQAIPEGSGATSVAVGNTETTCAIVNGLVECWGNNISGQLGDGTTVSTSRPSVVIGAGSGATDVATAQSGYGSGYTCAVVKSGVRCWGVGPYDAGAAASPNGPVQMIAASSGATRISTGGRHACAVVGGGVQCWGNNAFGQLGDGTSTDRFKPGAVMTNIAAPVSRAIEYLHAAFGHYFVTSISDEIAKLDTGVFSGWARTGLSFDVWNDAESSGMQVCRFFSVAFPPTSSHFYTANPSECAITKANPDWTYEGAVFRAKLPQADGNCATGTVPLYRMYNNGQGGAPNHRYTTDHAVRADMIAAGWVPEGSGIGVAMCVPP
ncbi:MAG: hypothetical protein U1F58_00485 [Burkholderiales bacterium]